MSKKRIISVIAACTMVMGLLAGCGSTAGSGTSTTGSSDKKADTSQTVSEAAGQTEGTEQDVTASGKTLVVYYSASGRTEAVAETIAADTGADLFEITPVEPYTEDDLNWTNNDSRVSKEHDDESLRDVELTQITPDNWDSYDTVLIGYPIWWGIAAWPVDNFVKGNDFTGKTVIPFCTSASSGIGQSGQLLEEMAGTGDWQEGQRFSSRASDSDITAWLQEIGL